METVEAVKRGVGDDKDVDIGDEMPVHDFPPVEIYKDDDKLWDLSTELVGGLLLFQFVYGVPFWVCN